MDVERLIVEELMRRTEEVASFANALVVAAGHFEWEVVEPHAELAWRQVAGDEMAWVEVRGFLQEVWASTR